jgi:hypothetical protein
MKSLEDEGIHREGEANLAHLEPLHVHGGVEVDINDEEAGAASKEEEEEGDNGHGCGL